MTTLDLSKLESETRLLIQANLQPMQGSRFQPTGFPDLGAAIYSVPGGNDMILVESAQSVANRLETVCWDEVADDWIEPLRGLPYVRVVDGNGATLTTSVLESHRLNSPYITNSSWFKDEFEKEVDYNKDEVKPVNLREKVYPALLKYDPNSLIHGIFLEKIGGIIRSPRALTGFIEAENVSIASSGGVKLDSLDPTGKTGGGAAKGFGHVPFSRDEFTAKSIIAYFNLDLAQIRAYGFSNSVSELLIALSMFKIGKFLANGLRLRTACDLELASSESLKVMRPDGYVLPSVDELENELPSLIGKVKNEGAFATESTTTVKWEPSK